MDDREKLLKRIQVSDFVLVETGLYLDTHPTDKMALDFFAKYQEIRKKATEEYNRLYGPLQAESFRGGNKWNWIDGPWPWQNRGD